ncbi:MAG: flagellar basal body P-ring protein FlgI [Oligoflexia bacterium]|nr:flagellar basal body P-ring protein FlgI [Oligoflexia bacterium]
MKKIIIAFLLSLLISPYSYAGRIKDLVRIKGVRENMLIGYGLVVGLKGTGDSSADVTGKALLRMFNKMGLKVETEVKSKNVASVVVTAKLPAFARAGQKIDVSVASVGDAGSLEGGTLLVTPLRAGDQQVYAVAQGTISLGSDADGSGKFSTSGRVPSGAIVEKELPGEFSNKKALRLSLEDPDFTTVARVARVINSELGGKYANAVDQSTIDLIVPFSYDGNAVELMAVLENLTVATDSKAKVVINEKTGTVVAGGRVRVKNVALSHGDLSIQVGGEKANKKDGGQKVLEIQATTSVSDLAKILNELGVSPKDLTAIFQAIKSAGALEGELEVL